MTTPLDVLDMLAAEPGKLEKRRIMAEHDSPELRKLLILAVSPYINFGVQQLPEVPDDTINPAPEFDEFFVLADKLASRELSGNAAKDALKQFFRRCSPQERQHFGGVLTKKLRCGVDSAINDVWPGSIPEFKPALAEDWFKTLSTPKKIERYGKYPKLLSVKLDGMRAIALYDNGSWGLYSREGRPIVGMPHIIRHLDAYGNPGKVYDGELYSHEVVTQKGFPFLVGLLKRQDWDHTQMRGKEAERVRGLVPWRDKVEFHLFDSISRASWDAQDNREAQLNRLLSLNEEVKEMRQMGAFSLVFVTHHAVHTYQEVEALNSKFLLEGFEGSMLKDPVAPYNFGRSANWLKLKMFQDGEYLIKGYYEGEGKWAGSLGGLNLETREGIAFNCGGGRVSKEERDNLWERRDELIGKQATIRFFELTPDLVPRFPILHAIRDYE